MLPRYQGSSAFAIALAGLCMWIAQAEEPRTGKAEKPRVVSSFQAEPGAAYPFRQNMYRALQLTDGRILALSIARDKRLAAAI